MRRFKYTLAFLLVLVLAQVGVSVAYSNFGGTIQELNEKAKSMALENQRLRVQTAKQESLTNVAHVAGELGFVESEVIYLTPKASEAQLPTSVNGETN
ncbi:hypothetical protein HYZ78_00795 [Candidatus Microgenomates bacterium]|nr:hypothetical protein [Candidatus Microgenomates bacterium]